jgi:hypothetical protein
VFRVRWRLARIRVRSASTNGLPQQAVYLNRRFTSTGVRDSFSRKALFGSGSLASCQIRDLCRIRWRRAKYRIRFVSSVRALTSVRRELLS